MFWHGCNNQLRVLGSYTKRGSFKRHKFLTAVKHYQCHSKKVISSKLFCRNIPYLKYNLCYEYLVLKIAIGQRGSFKRHKFLTTVNCGKTLPVVTSAPSSGQRRRYWKIITLKTQESGKFQKCNLTLTWAHLPFLNRHVYALHPTYINFHLTFDPRPGPSILVLLGPRSTYLQNTEVKGQTVPKI